MIRFIHVSLLMGVAMLALGAAGCSKSTNALKSNVFDSAGPEIKAKWEKATAAAATNDYATAVIAMNEIAAQTNLTTEQRTVLNDALSGENDRMFAAAQKGDPQAKAALDEIRKHLLQR